MAAAEGLTDGKGKTALAEWGLILRRRIPEACLGCVEETGASRSGAASATRRRMREEIAWPPGPAGQRQGGIDAHGPDGWVRWLETSGLTDWKEERVPCYSVIRGLHVWSVHFHAALSFLSWRCGTKAGNVFGPAQASPGPDKTGAAGQPGKASGLQPRRRRTSGVVARLGFAQLPGSIESGVQLKEMRNGGGEVNCLLGRPDSGVARPNGREPGRRG